jgi:hypothetical protein
MIEHRGEVVDRIRRGEDLYGQTIEELAPGWFRFQGRLSDLKNGRLLTGAIFYTGKRLAVVPASASAVVPASASADAP